jgi:hypothetical protein
MGKRVSISPAASTAKRLQTLGEIQMKQAENMLYGSTPAASTM